MSIEVMGGGGGYAEYVTGSYMYSGIDSNSQVSFHNSRRLPQNYISLLFAINLAGVTQFEFRGIFQNNDVTTIYGVLDGDMYKSLTGTKCATVNISINDDSCKISNMTFADGTSCNFPQNSGSTIYVPWIIIYGYNPA